MSAIANGHVRRGHGTSLEVRVIGHVARQRRVMPEHDVLDYRPSVAHRLEEIPQVRPNVIVVRSAEGDRLGHRDLADLRVVLLMPLLEVRVSLGAREAGRVLGWRFVPATPWRARI